MQRIIETKSGFTMVEISLAMVFISTLSLIIVMIIVNSVASYRRGITLNQINTVGMDLVDDMKLSIQASSTRSLKADCTELYEQKGVNTSALNNCVSDNGMSFALVQRRGSVLIEGERIGDVPIYGAFCTGKYSYLWNSGYFFGEGMSVDGGVTGVKLTYQIEEGGSKVTRSTNGTERLLKVNDPSRLVCKMAVGYDPNNINGGDYHKSNNYSSMPQEIKILSTTLEETPEDILKSDDYGNLALYDLTSTVPARTDGLAAMYYSVSFVLGTLQGGPNVKSSGNSCKVPDDYDSAIENFDYCAINKFNFAAQAVGG